MTMIFIALGRHFPAYLSDLQLHLLWAPMNLTPAAPDVCSDPFSPWLSGVSEQCCSVGSTPFCGSELNRTCREPVTGQLQTFRLSVKFSMAVSPALPTFLPLELLEWLLSLRRKNVLKSSWPRAQSWCPTWAQRVHVNFGWLSVGLIQWETRHSVQTDALPGTSLLSHSLVLTINFQQITDMKGNGSANCENHRKKINRHFYCLLVSELKL